MTILFRYIYSQSYNLQGYQLTINMYYTLLHYSVFTIPCYIIQYVLYLVTLFSIYYTLLSLCKATFVIHSNITSLNGEHLGQLLYQRIIQHFCRNTD